MAAATRSRLSRTATSGRPTMQIFGVPPPSWDSISTSTALTPARVAE